MWDEMNQDVDQKKANRILSDSLKHGNQQDNIVAKMCEGKLLTYSNDSKTIYVEYGAGKAGLSSFVAQKLAELYTQNNLVDKDGAMFLVVDRESRRYTKDRVVKEAGFEVARQKIDIADFDLVKYASLKT